MLRDDAYTTTPRRATHRMWRCAAQSTKASSVQRLCRACAQEGVMTRDAAPATRYYCSVCLPLGGCMHACMCVHMRAFTYTAVAKRPALQLCLPACPGGLAVAFAASHSKSRCTQLNQMGTGVPMPLADGGTHAAMPLGACMQALARCLRMTACACHVALRGKARQGKARPAAAAARGLFTGSERTAHTPPLHGMQRRTACCYSAAHQPTCGVG